MRDVDNDSPSASAWSFWKRFDGGEVCVVFIARRSVGALILQYSTWFASAQISLMVFFGKNVALLVIKYLNQIQI